MATVISHSIAALAMGKVFAPEGMPPKFWILTAVCAALPDIDRSAASIVSAAG